MANVKYRHVLAEDHHYAYYTESVFKKGKILKETDTPEKEAWYRVVLGHGVYEDIPGSKVKVQKVTTTTAVEDV
jgi:hypothetical protein